MLKHFCYKFKYNISISQNHNYSHAIMVTILYSVIIPIDIVLTFIYNVYHSITINIPILKIFLNIIFRHIKRSEHLVFFLILFYLYNHVLLKKIFFLILYRNYCFRYFKVNIIF